MKSLFLVRKDLHTRRRRSRKRANVLSSVFRGAVPKMVVERRSRPASDSLQMMQSPVTPAIRKARHMSPKLISAGPGLAVRSESSEGAVGHLIALADSQFWVDERSPKPVTGAAPKVVVMQAPDLHIRYGARLQKSRWQPGLGAMEKGLRGAMGKAAQMLDSDRHRQLLSPAGASCSRQRSLRHRLSALTIAFSVSVDISAVPYQSTQFVNMSPSRNHR